jgi:hypothetical protein
VVCIFIWGAQRAYFDLAPRGERYTLWRSAEAKDGPSTSDEVKLLRIYQNGVLVRLDREPKNQYVRWDQIRSLEIAKAGYPGKSLGCIQLGLLCNK